MSSEDFELLMPFTVVASVGGPFDDAAYCAGFELGETRVKLQMAKAIGSSLHCAIRSDNVPQADLLAMSEGYRLTVIAAEEAEGWTDVAFHTPEQRGEFTS